MSLLSDCHLPPQCCCRIRDSSVQMGIYIPRVRRRPALRQLVEGTLRTQALFITQVQAGEFTDFIKQGLVRK